MWEFSHFKDDAFPLTPSWSPDGKKVVFALRRNGATNLTLGAVDSGTLRQFTFTQGRDFNPVDSTDGHSISFHSNQGEWNAFGSWQLTAEFSRSRCSGGLRLHCKSRRQTDQSVSKMHSRN